MNILEGTWLLDQDRRNWNSLMRAMTGEVMRFDGTFNPRSIHADASRRSASLSELFTEGPYMDVGHSVTNVLSVLDHIALGILRGAYDSELVWVRLGRFFQMGVYFAGLLETDAGPRGWQNMTTVWEASPKANRHQGQSMFPGGYLESRPSSPPACRES
jgi:hypothetical protein